MRNLCLKSSAVEFVFAFSENLIWTFSGKSSFSRNSCNGWTQINASIEFELIPRKYHCLELFSNYFRQSDELQSKRIFIRDATNQSLLYLSRETERNLGNSANGSLTKVKYEKRSDRTFQYFPKFSQFGG